jgi:hypothetical protein
MFEMLKAFPTAVDCQPMGNNGELRWPMIHQAAAVELQI